MFNDSRFRALPPSQRSALQILPKLMAEHGKSGVLPWTRREICVAVQLGPKAYACLLETMARHEWGGENGEGWLVLSLPSREAEKARIIEEARPGIIREYEAGRKQKSRSLPTEEAVSDVRDISGTFPGHVPDTPSPYIDTPARVFESNSNRIEEEIYISIESNRIESKEAPAPEAVPASRVSLTIVPADIIQAMGRYGILEHNARQLLVEFGSEACARVLAAIPYWKPPNPAKRIYAALRNPDAWKWPADLTQGSLNLLTPQPGGAAPALQVPAPAASPPLPMGGIPSAMERLTEAERQRLHCEAIERLAPSYRAEYDKAISLRLALTSLLKLEITKEEDVILRGRLRKAGTG